MNITEKYLEGTSNGGVGSIFSNGAFVASFLGFLFAQVGSRPRSSVDRLANRVASGFLSSTTIMFVLARRAFPGSDVAL